VTEKRRNYINESDTYIYQWYLNG